MTKKHIKIKITQLPKELEDTVKSEIEHVISKYGLSLKIKVSKPRKSKKKEVKTNGKIS